MKKPCPVASNNNGDLAATNHFVDHPRASEMKAIGEFLFVQVIALAFNIPCCCGVFGHMGKMSILRAQAIR